MNRFKHFCLYCALLGLSQFSWQLSAQALEAQSQATRLASPAGSSAIEIGGHYDVREGYVDGKWIEIYYGRPIKRSRNLFGLADWREALMDGAEVWRAGANISTRLKTETALTFGDTRVEAGEYTVFIDFSGDEWLFVLSTWPAQLRYNYENHDALWGAFEYTADRDVLRQPMKMHSPEYSFDQLSWQFVNIDEGAGTLLFMWDRIQASIDFQVVSAAP
ncbi:MAG: hypothetical protein COC19_05410 [SAR86 cluster bacterium]|uniref:DUF2911 domain-containing protein n=1 Tax=SAR86 cluster bacterium TaxID=2030880 RepID=A0A2A4MM66_9GAMM|nr:MAG: hypothetical protein COC19_05410 [SAR86 cluster bacterium]